MEFGALVAADLMVASFESVVFCKDVVKAIRTEATDAGEIHKELDALPVLDGVVEVVSNNLKGYLGLSGQPIAMRVLWLACSVLLRTHSASRSGGAIRKGAK